MPQERQAQSRGDPYPCFSSTTNHQLRSTPHTSAFNTPPLRDPGPPLHGHCSPSPGGQFACAHAHTHGWTGGVKHEDTELRKVSTGFLGAPARSSRGRGRSLHKAEKWPPRRAVDLPAASHPLCLHKRPPSDSHRTSSFSAHHPRGWGS